MTTIVKDFDFSGFQLDEVNVGSRISRIKDLGYVLPPNTAKPGPIELFSYQEEILESLLDPEVTNVTCMMAAQTGKTQLGTLLLGDIIINDPHTVMLYFATREQKKEWLEEKLEPYLRSNEHVAEQLPSPSSKGWNENHINLRSGEGSLILKNAGTKNAFAQVGSRTIIADEIDKWEPSGITDVYNALTERSTTFSTIGYKIWVCSTPIWAGESVIGRLFYRGSQSRFWTPCFHCEEPFVFDWKRDADTENRKLYCQHNRCEISDFERLQMIDNGYWIADNPEVTKHKSYHLSLLQSKLVTLESLWDRWDDSESESEFLAGAMAIPPVVTETDSNLNEDGFAKYYRPCPFQEVQCRTGGVDVQHSRLEYTMLDWKGAENDSLYYVLTHSSIPFNLGSNHSDIWKYDLYEFIMDEYNPERVFVDSGDRQNYVLEHMGRLRDEKRWFPIKGVGNSFELGAVISRVAKTGVLRLGVDQLKCDAVEIVEADRLSVNPDDAVPHNYTAQFTSEKLQRKIVRGSVSREWVRKQTRRNEAWDCFIYAYAAQLTFMRERPYYNRSEMVDTSSLILGSLVD